MNLIPTANKSLTDLHNEHVDEFERVRAETGHCIDPVTGVHLPEGQVLVRDPNRQQRRDLAKWRKKVSR